jgi:hypothetical protein
VAYFRIPAFNCEINSLWISADIKRYEQRTGTVIKKLVSFQLSVYKGNKIRSNWQTAKYRQRSSCHFKIFEPMLVWRESATWWRYKDGRNSARMYILLCWWMTASVDMQICRKVSPSLDDRYKYTLQPNNCDTGRGGRGSDRAQGVLLPLPPSLPPYCDVTQARKYFAWEYLNAPSNFI